MRDCLLQVRPVSAVAKHIAAAAGGLEFDSWSSQITRSVVNGSPPRRCFFGAVLPRREAAEMDPASRYTLRRNRPTVSVMKNFFSYFAFCSIAMKSTVNLQRFATISHDVTR